MFLNFIHNVVNDVIIFAGFIATLFIVYRSVTKRKNDIYHLETDPYI